MAPNVTALHREMVQHISFTVSKAEATRESALSRAGAGLSRVVQVAGIRAHVGDDFARLGMGHARNLGLVGRGTIAVIAVQGIRKTLKVIERAVNHYLCRTTRRRPFGSTTPRRRLGS